jgi:protease II
VSSILPAGNDFSFSPTGRRLAYGLGNLIIRDLQTGDETDINTGGVFGPFFWSPDGLELAYATCQGDDNDSIKKSTVEIFSVQQNASRTVLELEKKFLTIEGLDANNILTVYSRDEQNNTDELFFDLNSSQWITPTPTP